MEKCALCNGKLKIHEEKNEKALIKGMECAKCKETFFSSSEIVRWEKLTNRRKN
ncbi:MAG: hypothetical protein V1911_02755 [Candidatus Micrarchaeota archaeon]